MALVNDGLGLVNYMHETALNQLLTMQQQAYYTTGSAANSTSIYYPGQAILVQRQEDLMCVGNGWGNQHSEPMWQQAFSSTKEWVKKHLQFFRINESIEHPEGASYQEPLDELRLKVSRWLKGLL